jgi:hypothetical protein
MADAQSALEMVGGFDAYQNRLYQAIKQRVGKMKVDDVLQTDRALSEGDPDYFGGGLSEGLLGLVLRQRFLTGKNFEDLSQDLSLSIEDLFEEELKPYLSSPIAQSAQPVGLPSDKKGARETQERGQFIFLYLAMGNESDAIIAARKAAA